MSIYKSQLAFNKSQRVGILILIGLIVGAFVLSLVYQPKNTNVFDLNSPEVISVQQEIDSLRLSAIESRKPKLFPFNPNFITDYKAYTLGMSPAEFDRLKTFRNKDQWINSVADFKKVTKIDDSTLASFSGQFKFPDWVTNPKPKYQNKSSNYKRITTHLPYAQKIDLNAATVEELQKVSGIGPAISERIVKYRDQTLQGFSADTQLNSVWGLDSAVVARALMQFTVKTPVVIHKMNINTASASDLSTIRGINFDLAKEIWEFRVLRERIDNLDDLLKIDGVTANKLSLIKLYLSVE